MNDGAVFFDTCGPIRFGHPVCIMSSAPAGTEKEEKGETTTRSWLVQDIWYTFEPVTCTVSANLLRRMRPVHWNGLLPQQAPQTKPNL